MYLLRRLAQAALVVAGVVVLTFVVMRAIPGDPAVAYAGPRASAAQLAQVRVQLGLGRPMVVQLWDYVWGLVRGDWGISLHTRQSVLSDITTAFLRVQVEAGAAAVQLFDSWAGVVGPGDYRAAVLPHSKRIFAALDGLGVPRIHFGVGTGELLGELGEAGADVVGVDWRVGLDEAARRVGTGKALQGNLDPAILLAPWPVIEERVKRVLAQGRVAEGHVFNLGHGVLPQTDPDVLARVTDLVHTESARARG